MSFLEQTQFPSLLTTFFQNKKNRFKNQSANFIGDELNYCSSFPCYVLSIVCITYCSGFLGHDRQLQRPKQPDKKNSQI
jgi:hypothetical protein